MLGEPSAATLMTSRSRPCGSLIFSTADVSAARPSTTRLASPGWVFINFFHSACRCSAGSASIRSEEHTSELQSRLHLVCRLLLEKKKVSLTIRLPSVLFACSPLSHHTTLQLPSVPTLSSARTLQRHPCNVPPLAHRCLPLRTMRV